MNLRPIVVENHHLRWRFDDTIVVIPAERSGPQLVVEWGWIDWLEPDGPGNEPLVVTPKFVADAVKYALHVGWDPGKNGPPTRLNFANGEFSVTSANA